MSQLFKYSRAPCYLAGVGDHDVEYGLLFLALLFFAMFIAALFVAFVTMFIVAKMLSAFWFWEKFVGEGSEQILLFFGFSFNMKTKRKLVPKVVIECKDGNSM